MGPDSRHLATTLAQVLENFQRCGVTRFGSQAASELPPEWLAYLAELQQPLAESPAATQAVSTQRTALPAATAPLTPGYDPAASPAVDSPTEKLAASALTTPFRPTSGSGGTSGLSAGLKNGGLAAEPWSLPVLSSDERQQRFELLNGQACDCRRCPAIVTYRQQTVFGDGHLRPTVCFMGEAPGADEDRTGKPFVGKAGQLLTKIIGAMKLRREDVYILNALKCRPPQNRTPISDEIDNCRTFVEQQLDTLQPRFIVCLGAVAVRSLLQSDLSIGSLRGQFHHYRGARVVVTYHPSYLLRNESAKRLVWDDMKMLMAELPSA